MGQQQLLTTRITTAQNLCKEAHHHSAQILNSPPHSRHSTRTIFRTGHRIGPVTTSGTSRVWRPLCLRHNLCLALNTKTTPKPGTRRAQPTCRHYLQHLSLPGAMIGCTQRETHCSLLAHCKTPARANCRACLPQPTITTAPPGRYASPNRTTPHRDPGPECTP